MIMPLLMGIKKILLITLLTVSFLVSFATDYYVATKDLNVRTGEGKEYPVSFTLQKGEEVEILSKHNDWYRVKYFEQFGYAHSRYLKYSRAVSNEISNTHDGISFSYFFIGICICLSLLIVFFLFRNWQDKKLLETVTQTHRGTKSERDLVLALLKSGTPPHVIFHDLYLQTKKDYFSQTDLAIVTNVGIIVFEVKEYSG
jgi:hypothetical protein